MMIRTARNGPVVFRGGPNGQIELWSPQELVMESSLTARFDARTNERPTAEAAAGAARKVEGKWTTYLAFSKSSMGVGFEQPYGHPGLGRGFRPFRPPDPNEPFVNLTPEQRVEQARRRLGLAGK